MDGLKVYLLFAVQVRGEKGGLGVSQSKKAACMVLLAASFGKPDYPCFDPAIIRASEGRINPFPGAPECFGGPSVAFLNDATSVNSANS